jgi:hypothetical protein
MQNARGGALAKLSGPASSQHPTGISNFRARGRITLNANRLIVGALAISVTSVASAGGPTTLGVPMGVSLGATLGQVMGFSLGSVLPIAGGGLLTVAAASLVVGICLVRRKKKS